MNINQPLNLKDVILKVFKNKLKTSDYWTLLIAYYWKDIWGKDICGKDICGKDLAERTKPKCIKNNILIINVNNPALSFELNFFKKELIEKINTFLSALTDDPFTKLPIYSNKTSNKKSNKGDGYANQPQNNRINLLIKDIKFNAVNINN